MKTLFLRLAGLALLPIAMTGFAPPREVDARQALESQLRTEYRWAQVDGRNGEVISPGAVLIVRREGITTNPVIAPLNAQNNFKDGQIKRSALNLFTQEQATAGRFVTGDRVYVTKTEVKDTAVVLSLVSVDPIGPMRAKASIAFQFPKGYVTTTDFNQVARIIDEVLGVPPEARRRAPPPPPPPPQPTQEVTLGATIAQVRQALGPPERVADLGPKQIYIYPNLKVTFIDGKVTDVN